MSGYQDSAHGFTLLTPGNPPTVPAVPYRATYTDTDGNYKIVAGDGTTTTIPLFKGMNPVEIKGVYSSPAPAGTVWGVT